MGWFRSAEHLALELAPTAWTVAGAERTRERGLRLKAVASFDPQSASLSEEIRHCRLRDRLPFDATLVMWPAATDPGVATLDSRSRVAVSLPKARVIRERIAPFVRAGGRAKDVVLPHEAAGRLVRLAGWTSASVMILEPTSACLAIADGTEVVGAYLHWPELPVAETDAARLLARYQFAARLVPHLRGWAANGAGTAMAVCGRFPDLRASMVPIVEELDREVEVLDADWLGLSVREAGDPAEVAGSQLAWAVAGAGVR